MKNMDTRVHRNTDLWIMEHACCSCTLVLPLFPTRATLPKMSTMAGHQLKRFRTLSLNYFQFHSLKKKREMGKEKFPLHKLRTALPEASSIHPVQCHSNTSVWSETKSKAHTLLGTFLSIEELMVAKIIRWNNTIWYRGQGGEVVGLILSNTCSSDFTLSKIITIIPQRCKNKMRTKVLWIGVNQGMNGRMGEAGHLLIHAHALLRHSI